MKKLIQKIKCFYGFHQIAQGDWIMMIGSTWCQVRCCHCNKMLEFGKESK
jgi:hypothetical protein